MTFLGLGGNEVRVRVTGDASQLTGTMVTAEKGVRGFATRSTTALTGLATYIKTGLVIGAAAGIASFVSSAIEEGSKLEEAINAARVVFGEWSDEILGLAEDAALAVGLSESEFLHLSVSFSNFVETIAAERDGDIAATMEELTTRIADFGSVMDLDIPEAAAKFQSALAGQSRPMREFGIDVSDAAVKLKALELGVEGVNGELTQADKVFVRYQILLDETEEMAGDFANTSDDLANAQRILNSQWSDFLANISGPLTESLAFILGFLNDSFEALDRLLNPDTFDNTALGKLINDIQNALQPVADLLNAIDRGLDAVGNFIGGSGPIKESTRRGRDGNPVGEGYRHAGGIVPGPRGREVSIRALGGERVTNPDLTNNLGGGGGATINYYAGTNVSNTRILRELIEMGRRK